MEVFSAKTSAISPPHFRASEVHRDGNAGPRWKKWLGIFEILTIGMRISDEKQIRALLLHYGGTEVTRSSTRFKTLVKTKTTERPSMQETNRTLLS